MASVYNAQTVTSKVTDLTRFWQIRNKKMRDWYGQIQMVDALAQKDMESFVGNDPRVTYNQLRGILLQRIPHRLPAEYIGVQEVTPAAELSRMFDIIWENIVLNYRQRGRLFHRDLINFLLATGWYSVFAIMSLDGTSAMAEVWNPYTVYPMWDDIMTECAHVFQPGKSAVEGMILRNGWKVQGSVSNNTEIKDYWWTERTVTAVVVHNSILVGGEQVKPDTVEPRLKRIPIFTSPIGGLPDMGNLSSNAELWKGEIGQSFVATNENVFKTSNKWWTFVLQLLRDTAQARTYERTNSAKQIVQPETWYKRGAHYKIGQQDEIGFIQPPAVPVEIRSAQLDLEAMIAKGGPGQPTTQQRLTSYAMAQISGATNQMASDYHGGIVDCITDIDNFFYDMITENNYKPYEIPLPSGLPIGVKLSAEYELRIPGDLVQRATTARMLNPEFELSDERIMEEQFPEIKNPIEEMARVRASKARKHPIYVQLSLISTLRAEAALLLAEKNPDDASLYEQAAARLEQEISGQPQQSAQQGAPGIRPEVLPPQTARPPATEEEI